MALPVGLAVHRLAEAARHFHAIAQFGGGDFAQQRIQLRVVDAPAGFAQRRQRAPAFRHQDQLIVQQVVAGLEVAPHADRPAGRCHVQRQALLDFVDQIQRLAPLAVQLVDEGDDRHVAQAADFEQFAGLLLDPLGGIDHHHRRVDGGQRAVGILAEIFVARRIEQIEGAVEVIEGHDGGGDRNSALPLHLHPVRFRPPRLALRLHRPRRLDGTAEQQQLLGQRRLAGIGVGDDRKRAPAGDGGWQDEGHAGSDRGK